MDDTRVALKQAEALLDILEQYVKNQKEELRKADLAITAARNNEELSTIEQNPKSFRRGIVVWLHGLK